MLMRTGIVLALVAGGALAAPDELANSEGRIKQLREERVAVLKQIQETVVALLAMGTEGVGAEHVHQATTELLRARLELASSRQERITIHEELVAQAKKSLEVVTARASVGAPGGSQIDVLKAKAYYLEFQVALEQAKAAN